MELLLIVICMLFRKGKLDERVLLAPENWRKMTSPQSRRTTGAYGFGPGLAHDAASKQLLQLSHGGSLSGFLSYVVVDFRTKRFAVVNYTVPRQKQISNALTNWVSP